MSTTLDSVVIPTFTNGLKTLDHILTKATTYAETKNIDPNTYVSARLIEDQLPLSFQVQNATKTVVTTLGRFGVPVTPFEDKEYTVEDLRARIKVALDLLASVKAGAYEKGEEGVVDV